MYEQAFETLRKATEAAMKMQQETLEKWAQGFTPVAAAVPPSMDSVAPWRKKWESAVAESLTQHKQLLDQTYDASVHALEDIFQAADAQSPQELQEKVTALYRKSFESMRHLSEAQLAHFKIAVEKWTELVTTTS